MLFSVYLYVTVSLDNNIQIQNLYYLFIWIAIAAMLGIAKAHAAAMIHIIVPPTYTETMAFLIA